MDLIKFIKDRRDVLVNPDEISSVRSYDGGYNNFGSVISMKNGDKVYVEDSVEYVYKMIGEQKDVL